MLNHAMRYVIIIIGCLLAAAAYDLFLIPMNFLSGGLAGIAFILYYLFNLPIGIMNFLLNIPILYIAYRYFGRLYFFDTILGTILFSVGFNSFFKRLSTIIRTDVVCYCRRCYLRYWLWFDFPQ